MQKNPLIRALKTGRPTLEEKIDAYKYIRDEDAEVQAYLHQVTDEPVEHTLIHHSTVTEAARKLVLDDGAIVGLTTGWQAFDEMTRGILPSEIIVLYATPGIGKSLVAQNIALNLGRRNIPVLFIGLEMTNEENEARFIKLTSNETELQQMPIYFPQNAVVKPEDIDGLVKSGKELGVELVVIDHLHMWSYGGRSEAEGIANVMKELKQVAKEYSVPILLLAQCNRQVVGVPELTDLLGSSSIEQIASVAITLWKDPELPDEQAPLKVVCRKQRKGPKRKPFELYPVGGGRLVERVAISDVHNYLR